MDEEVSYRDYDHLLAFVLGYNQLTLFGLDGSDKTLDRATHAADHFDEYFVWGSEQERFEYTLQLTIDVWASWEIHLRKSSYALPYFGCVEVQDAWLAHTSNTPPCIIMANQLWVGTDETPALSPFPFAWKSEHVLGPVVMMRSPGDEEGGPSWRLYLRPALERILGRSIPSPTD